MPQTRSITVLCALLAAAGSVIAGPLTPGQALTRALESKGLPVPSRSEAGYRLAYSEAQDVYVFSAGAGGGFLAVSGDTDAPPVLGYSDVGSFDPDAMPPAMKWWLEQYSAQIQAGAGQTCTASAPRLTFTEITPMVTTKWNQDSPYNDACPEVGGKRTVTGCVATAMAQIVRYHKWPEQTKGGTVSYTLKGSGVAVSFDFSSYRPAWADMPDVAPAGNTAVAQLMLACGVGSDMDYSSDESGADPREAMLAYVDNFDYDNGIRYYDRAYYTKTEWDDLVYSQLRDYGPVQYNGQSGSGGHSFVCDGCDADGYFHINWGWGGMSDGYFLLTALDPMSQGIGGADSGFNSDQSIIGNIRKPGDLSTFTPCMGMTGALSFSTSSVQLGGYATVDTPTFNFSAGSISGRMGLRLTDSTGKTICCDGTRFSGMSVRSGYRQWSATIPATLADGTYTATPVFNYNDMWYDVSVPVSGTMAYRVVVGGGRATFSPINRSGIVAMTGLRALTPICFGSKLSLSATISNAGNAEFYGKVVPALLSGQEIVAMGPAVTVDLEPGVSEAFSYSGILSGEDAVPGDYILCFVDPTTLEVISDEIEVSVEQLEFTVSDLKYNGYNPSDLNFSARITCQSGMLDAEYELLIANMSGAVIYQAGPQPISIRAGESKEISTQASAPALNPGTQYLAVYFVGGKQQGNPISFTPGNLTGISLPGAGTDAPAPDGNVTDGRIGITGDGILGVRVFSVTGRCVATAGAGADSADLSALPAGIYFVEITYGADAPRRAVYKVARR